LTLALPTQGPLPDPSRGSGPGSCPGPNPAVAEVRDLRPTIDAYLEASWSVAVELFDLATAVAHGLAEGIFTSHASRPVSSLNVNY
jgi:hypothetical protein